MHSERFFLTASARVDVFILRVYACALSRSLPRSQGLRSGKSQTCVLRRRRRASERAMLRNMIFGYVHTRE